MEVGFVTDIYSAEDLAHVPDSKWLLTSGMAGPGTQGHLYAVDREAKVAHEIFPGGGGIVAGDPSAYDVVKPPDLADFSAVGVGLRLGDGEKHTLYVVNHGGRSAVEVFAIDMAPEVPTATWVGVIPHAPGVLGNAVAPLPDGGIIATNFMSLEDPYAVEKVLAGEATGNVKEWHAGRGWEDVPGTECCSANGVDISPDGRWVFVNAWATNKVIRVSRGRTPFQRDELAVAFMPDNVKWSHGRVLVTGQTGDAATVLAGVSAGPTYDAGLKVIAVDPETLAVEELVDFSEPGGFGTAATAIQVEDEIWVSSARSDRIAYFKGALA